MFPDKTGVSAENERRPGTTLYVDGYPRQPKRILLSTGMISFPDALKNIKTVISREDYAVMNLAEIFKNMGIGEK